MGPAPAPVELLHELRPNLPEQVFNLRLALLFFVKWSATFSFPLMVLSFTLPSFTTSCTQSHFSSTWRSLPKLVRLPMASAALLSVHSQISAFHPNSSASDCIPKPSSHPVTIA